LSDNDVREIGAGDLRLACKFSNAKKMFAVEVKTKALNIKNLNKNQISDNIELVLSDT